MGEAARLLQEQRGHWPVYSYDRDRNYPGRVQGSQGDPAHDRWHGVARRRDNLGHDLVGVVDALAPAVAQRERERSGEVLEIGGRQLVGFGQAAR